MATTAARRSVHSAVHGVSTSPGATALTRTCGPTTLASSRVMWLSAALLTAYGMDEPDGRTPASDDTFTRRRTTASPIPDVEPVTSATGESSDTSDTAADRHAAVDRHGLTGDPGRVIREQKRRELRRVLGAAEPLERVVRGDLFFFAFV